MIHLRRPSPGIAVLTLMAALLASSCAVGPDYRSPAAPTATRYTPAPLSDPAAASADGQGVIQRFVPGEDVPGRWWTLFKSPRLNHLVDLALLQNPDLQAAQATLRQARETLWAQEGSYSPTVGAGLSAARERASTAIPGVPKGVDIFNVYNAQVNVSYTLDVFGLTRREVEAAAAQASYQAYELEATYLTLTSNVVTAAIQEASLEEQITATQAIVHDEKTVLDLLHHQFQAGAVSQNEILAQEAALDQSIVSLPPLAKQLAQVRDLLCDLTGRTPDQDDGLKLPLASLTLPPDLPVSLPSRLVGQRPDIGAAAATLHRACAQIGVATAVMLPQITITGDYGSSTLHPNDLFSPSTLIWGIAAGLTQPIFAGGTLMHQRRAAIAGYDAAAATYRSVVLGAFRNVADSLRVLQYDAEALSAEVSAEGTASRSLAIARERFKAGAISYLALIDAERTYQQAHIGLVIFQSDRFADTAALYAALGGGWWNRSDIAPAQAGDGGQGPGK